MNVEFLQLRDIVGPSRDVRTREERWRYAKKLRYAQRMRDQIMGRQATPFPSPFRRQAY